MVLAERLAKGMKDAYAAIKKEPIDASKVSWRFTTAALPVSKLYNTKELKAKVADDSVKEKDRLAAARNLHLERAAARPVRQLTCNAYKSAPLMSCTCPASCSSSINSPPRRCSPNSPVMMAAYGDYGMGYMGTSISYTQGGYETGPAWRVGPEVEAALMKAMFELLK